jgi:hypothetical protein
MTIASAKSPDGKEMLAHYRGAWFGLRQDEEGVISLVLACSDLCCTKLLES